MLKALSRSSSELSGLLSRVSLRQILCCLALWDSRPLRREKWSEDKKLGAFTINCAIAVQLNGVRKVLTSKCQKRVRLSRASSKRICADLQRSRLKGELHQPKLSIKGGNFEKKALIANLDPRAGFIDGRESSAGLPCIASFQAQSNLVPSTDCTLYGWAAQKWLQIVT